MPLTADTLPIAKSALIINILNSPLKINLMELGFMPGKELTLNFAAPFGGPMAFQLEDTVLALRKSEAALIQIKLV